MLHALILVISVLGFNQISASEELSLKQLVKKGEQSALLEKKAVDSLIAQAAEVTTFAESQVKEKQSAQNCPILGCTSMMASKKPSEKTSPLLEGNKPLIFVSSSMPIESLKRLAYQAVQHDAILVIRGMVKNSMLETAKLVDQIDHPLEIDPKLFEQFEIQKVPVFLINHATSWHKVSGNVELNFALESVHKDQIGHVTKGDVK